MAIGLACACTGSPSVRAPDVPGFDRRAMVDVLPPDRITSIDEPTFETPGQAGWLDDDVPVLVVERGEFARAYPLPILTVHEVVNDRIGGEPAVVTYSPLTDSAVVYARRLEGGQELSFGSSGKLYRSNSVVYDRQTISLWAQLDGTAVLGAFKGRTLERWPSVVAPFGAFADQFPDGEVLRRPGSSDYGDLRPYPGYDLREEPLPGFFQGALDVRVASMDRVVAAGGTAYRFADLERAGPLNEPGSVLFWAPGARSVFGDEPVGSAGMYANTARGRRLTFSSRDGAIVDDETGSTWSILGVATAGRMRGARLERLAHTASFWFAWAAFNPGTDVWDGL